MGKSDIVGPAGIVKIVAVITGIILLGLTVGSRPGFLYRQSSNGGPPYELSTFFEMAIIAMVFAILSFLASVVGASKNSLVRSADAGVHLLVAIFLIMYTARSMEASLNNYDDYVKQVCDLVKPKTGSKENPFEFAYPMDEEEDSRNCVLNNPLYEGCICALKVVSKYELTIAAYAFGIIHSLSHMAVGLTIFATSKSD